MAEFLHAPDGRTPRAIVFDLDGTLADTMPAHFLAWTDVVNEAGLLFPEERFYAMGGVPTRTIFDTLIAEAGDGVSRDAAALSAKKEEAFRSHIPACKPAPKVLAVLRSAQAAGVPCAVATGGNRGTATATLAAIGLADDFPATVVVTADDTAEHKPHPAPFLLAAERLGVAPGGCDAYEDTDLGLESIAAAGMRGIDVRTL
ncbi:HAD family hydrolase [Phycisphaera mikurensis]|uniref:Putative phosphatase n=1 Tax=Phycisphaera mikurensis (strain NBRC 102666 / KCTC 22515 / FYK2301M01) TaxID=1142394 RepID=I0IIT8_PHYMF|nr:HAD family hydrolase [Phycisphaera mikurensis]MBB6442680.1 HAD superfamily hydrolase (TIGR01509 family) [Phycisphaera mikurensis]BAM05176.1 putative phosphatase [Phycisphaera mikurensis NBRC 102666]